MSRPAEDLFPAGYQFLDDSGAVLNAGKVFVYVNDQAYTTQRTVYKDAARQVPWTQPIVLGADGRLSSPVKATDRVDIRILDADDNQIDTHPNAGSSHSAVSTDLNENLLSNWSFEIAGSGAETFENWTDTDTGSVISRDTSDSAHGAASAKFTGANNGTDYIESDLFEVTPQKRLELEFLVKASNASAEPAMAVYWLTGAQGAISNEYIYKDDFGLTPTEWTLKEGFSVTPPSTARYARLRIYGNEAGTQYDTNFDGISVAQRTPLTGGVVTQIPIGLNLSIDSGDTEHDINVTAGSVLNSTLSSEIVLTSEITKQIDASWAAGDDAGGLFAGSTLAASGRLGVYLIKNSTTGQVDVGFDDNAALSPTLPSGFDVYRYIGSMILDENSNIMNAVWFGEKATFLGNPDAQVEDTTISDAVVETATINAPPDAEIDYKARIEIISGAVEEFVGQVRPADSDWPTNKFGTGMEGTDDVRDELWWEHIVRVSPTSQIDYAVDYNGHAGDVEFYLYMQSWNDLRRNNP